MTDELKRTGRTQRMLEAALELVGKTTSIGIVADSVATSELLKERLRAMVDQRPDMELTLRTYDGFKVEDTWVHFVGDNPSETRGCAYVLADHLVRDLWLSQRQGWWDWEHIGEAE